MFAYVTCMCMVYELYDVCIHDNPSCVCVQYTNDVASAVADSTYVLLRWVKQMNKKKLPYLRSYAPPDASYYEGLAVQGQHSREIFLVRQQRRHAFPDFSTFLKMGFSIDTVKMVDRDIIAALPLGDALPSIP